MIRQILLGACIALAGSAIAQSSRVNSCGTDAHHRQMTQNNPQMQEMEREFQQYWQQYKQTEEFKKSNKQRSKNSAPKYIIPVVVHVFYTTPNAVENISDAQIQSEIDFLNKSFRNLNSDTSNRRSKTFKGVPFDYKSLAADAEIEFRLARKDPNGNCTNGIIRIQTSDAVNGNDNLKLLSVWDSKRYFNIWVVRSINRGLGGPGIAGYAQFPFFAGGAGSALTDGIMVIHNEFGNMGSSLPGQTPNVTTTTHEAGHWFGLFHPFQGDSCSMDNDGVEDTPPTYFVATASEPLRNRCNNDTFNSCNTEAGAVPFIDYPDMQENFMDYFIGSCASNMFTKEQVARMHFCIDTYRRQLVEQSNLVSTGVLDPVSVCAPIPAFGTSSGSNFTNSRVACVGSSINFTDLSYNGTATSWSWNFGDGATPATSTVRNPSNVVYSTSGKKTITLTVTNASGTNTRTFTDALDIVAPAPIQQPAWATDAPQIVDGWIINREGNTNWQVIQGLGVYSGLTSIRLPGNNLNNLTNEYSLITPAFDFSGASTPYFNFRYSFAQNNVGGTASTDEMDVQVSTNCGLTWQNLRPTLSAATMSAVTAALPISVNFVPQNETQWKSVSISSTAIPRQANVRFRILFRYGGGNNLYLDDFNMGLRSGAEELTATSIGLSVYPNPTNSTAQISYNLPVAAPVNIELFDITGRVIGELFNGTQTGGVQEVQLDRAKFGLQSGVYFIKINVNGASITQKVVFN
ncbi:MAG: T9SS type A sorting domain-containing protein [Bacteroidia bacterium]|jgi:PKD repeat protein|nr:T9SS type A sorting domain-containing protein [Bacteroidia bacterium]